MKGVFDPGGPCPIGGPDGKHDFDFDGGGFPYEDRHYLACECGAMKCMQCHSIFRIGDWIRGNYEHMCEAT